MGYLTFIIHLLENKCKVNEKLICLINKKETAFRLPLWCARRDGVAASFISLASAQVPRLTYSAAAPFPNETAALGFAGDSGEGRVLRHPLPTKKKNGILTDAVSFWCARRDLNPHVRIAH